MSDGVKGKSEEEEEDGCKEFLKKKIPGSKQQTHDLKKGSLTFQG